MQTLKTIINVQKTIKTLKLKGKVIGFIPTMGALHEGHLSLIRKARKECDIVVISIFVNPLQFAPTEDFAKYPRVEKSDKMLAKKEGVDIIITPTTEEMYSSSFLTTIQTKYLGNFLCGKSRPGHFDGVTTVVGKLLNIVTPDKIYFGQKDFQQCVIIKKMIDDLNFPVTMVVCPIVREKSGLALSSRNSYLTAKQRNEADNLYRSLKEAKKQIKTGVKTSSRIVSVIKKIITQNTSGIIDYIEVVDTKTLKSQRKLAGKVAICIAVKFGKTRLIDNIIIKA